MRCEISKARRLRDSMFGSGRNTLSKFSPDRQKRPAIAAGIIALLLFTATALRLRAQEKNPFSGDAKAAKLGESQFARNCDSPSFAAFASPENGFFSCARSLSAVAVKSSNAIIPAAIAGRFCLSGENFERVLRPDPNMLSLSLLALEISHRMATSLQ